MSIMMSILLFAGLTVIGLLALVVLSQGREERYGNTYVIQREAL